MLSQLKDTLTCDSSLLHQFQSDEAYNYARELEAPDSSLFGWILQQISRFLNDVFSIKSDGDVRILLYILVALTLLGVVGYLLWRYKPALFRTEGRSSKNAFEENNIYGIDFEAEFDKARRLNDYNRCVCIVYLQTLRWLADNHRINWQIYKTPTQYTKEFLLPAFARFTNLFMRVRYGNYQADSGQVALMLELQKEITEGGQP